MENQQLLEHIGKTKTSNLIEDIEKEYFERKYKSFGIKDNQETVTPVSVVTSTKDDEIKQIGTSCMNDLLLDNWGAYYQVIYGRYNLGASMKLTSGSTVQFRANSTQRIWNNGNTACGTQVQIGTGTTPATTSDYQIETPFVGGIEAIPRSTGIGFYTVGSSTANVSTHWSPMSQAGAISETTFQLNIKRNDTAVTVNPIIISRDNISPVVNFNIGEQVNVDYSFLFN
jgi:hypothetical protein